MTGQPRDATAGPDGGVIRRVRRRTVGTAIAFVAVGVALAVLGWGGPRWFAGAAGAVIGGAAVAVCVVEAVVLGRRAVLWSRAERLMRATGPDDPSTGLADPPTGLAHPAAGLAHPAAGLVRPGRTVDRAPGIPATCGPPVPLRKSLPGAFRVRRSEVRAHVLPLRARSGPLASGRAVIVHPRTDRLLPLAGDTIEVRSLGRRGPFLIARPADGVLFVADGWTLSVL